MDNDIGFMKIKPDQMQVINPFLILVFIPLYEVLFYPILSKIGIRRPLQKLTLGGTYAGIAFLLSAGVELALEPGYAVLPSAGVSQLRIYSGMSCDYKFANTQGQFDVKSLEMFEDRHVWVDGNNFTASTYTVKSAKSECPDFEGQFKFELESEMAVSYIMRTNQGKLEIERFMDSPVKARNGNPLVRVLANVFSPGNITIREGEGVRYNELSTNTSSVSLPDGSYHLFLGETEVSEEHFKLGGVFTVIVRETSAGKFETKRIIITEPNSISILWQIPQYVVME